MPAPDELGLRLPDTPAGIRPVPADRDTVRRGVRVLVGDPGYGFVGDLRADELVEHGGKLHVPVLEESDWYRAERDDVDVFAPLVPAGRVWVEQLDPALSAIAAGGGMVERLVELAAPAARPPIAARDVPALTGRRVVVVGTSPAGEAVEHRDLRAVSEPYEAADHSICLRVTKEPDWYRARTTGATVRSNRVPIYLVWVE